MDGELKDEEELAGKRGEGRTFQIKEKHVAEAMVCYRG